MGTSTYLDVPNKYREYESTVLVNSTAKQRVKFVTKNKNKNKNKLKNCNNVRSTRQLFWMQTGITNTSQTSIIICECENMYRDSFSETRWNEYEFREYDPSIALEPQQTMVATGFHIHDYHENVKLERLWLYL